MRYYDYDASGASLIDFAFAMADADFAAASSASRRDDFTIRMPALVSRRPPSQSDVVSAMAHATDEATAVSEVISRFSRSILLAYARSFTLECSPINAACFDAAHEILAKCSCRQRRRWVERASLSDDVDLTQRDTFPYYRYSSRRIGRFDDSLLDKPTVRCLSRPPTQAMPRRRFD